jgi:predicted RNA-binding protein with TRAM domain
MNPESLSVEIILENQKFEVKSPFAAMYPKGLKHTEHIVAGCGWLVNIHLSDRSILYGVSPESCPVQVGKEYELDISEVSRGGQGIAKINDFAVFVPDTKLGDQVKVKITKISQLAADAETVK